MGFILLIIAIILYPINRVYSIFLFLTFSLNGFRILPDIFLDAKLTHMALGYIVVIGGYNIFHLHLNRLQKKLNNKIVYFELFIISSILFSIVYYQYSIGEVISTGLRYSILLGFFCFINLKDWEYKKVINILFYITFITSILYCAQIITGIKLLQYSSETFDTPESNGLFKFYNSPPLGGLFLYISLFASEYIPSKWKLASKIVFPLALLLSMGRTSMLVTGVVIIIGFLLNDSFKKNVLILLMILLLLIPFYSLISSRINKEGETKNDIQMALNLNFKEIGENGGHGGTFTYRIAWIYERAEYIFQRPFYEPLFGLGLITDESTDAQKKYHFNFGLLNIEKGFVAQIRTPDIAWGNLLTILGLLGSFFFLNIWFFLIRFFNKIKKTELLALSIFLLLVAEIMSSISCASISEPYTLLIYFFFFTYFTNNQFKNNIQ